MSNNIKFNKQAEADCRAQSKEEGNESTEVQSQEPLVPDNNASKLEESSFIERLRENYAPSVVFFFAMCAFCGGFGMSRGLCTLNIYKEVFKLEPSQIQRNDAILQLIAFFRIPLSLAIDLKILRHRKYILFFCGLGQAVSLAGIASGLAYEVNSFFICLFCDQIFGLVVCSIKDALWVEQARNDIKNGQGDINTVFIICGTIGSGFGCLIAAYLQDIKQPRIAFLLCLIFIIFQSVSCLALSSSIESNPLATGKDIELMKYEAEQRRIHPERYGDDGDVELPGLHTQLKFKLKSIWQGLNIPSVRRFILFQILQGLSMPAFPAFDYCFTLDVLKIPLDMINLQNVWLGWVCFLVPIIYQRYLKHSNFVYMILISQMIYIMADSIGVSLALGWNTAIGIPTKLGYVFFAITTVLDGGFNSFPAYVFFGKVVPQGVESTTVGILFYIMMLNNITFRQILGIYINDHYVHVTRENMDNYPYLKIICLCCNFLPFLYMWYLVPTIEEANTLQKAIAYAQKVPLNEVEATEFSNYEDDQEERERLIYE